MSFILYQSCTRQVNKNLVLLRGVRADLVCWPMIITIIQHNDDNEGDNFIRPLPEGVGPFQFRPLAQGGLFSKASAKHGLLIFSEFLYWLCRRSQNFCFAKSQEYRQAGLVYFSKFLPPFCVPHEQRTLYPPHQAINNEQSFIIVCVILAEGLVMLVPDMLSRGCFCIFI